MDQTKRTAARIKQLRQARGMTQRELGEPEYSAAYISQVENGKRKARPRTLVYLAEKLGVDAEDLRTGIAADARARLEMRVQDARRDVYCGFFQSGERRLRGIRHRALRSGLREIAARAQEGIALSRERQGFIEEGLREFDQALKLWGESPPPLWAETVSGRARCLYLLGDVRYSIHVLESYLDELERVGMTDPTAQVRTYSTLVGAYFAAGLVNRALEIADDALRLEPVVDSPEQVATMHLNVARSLLVGGHSEAALRSLQKAETLYIQVQRKHDAAYAHIARGIVLAAEGRYEPAKEAFEWALESFSADGARHARARAITELARVERLSGRMERARDLLADALALLQGNDVGELALAHRELALCSMADDRDVAEKHLWQSVELYKRMGDHLKQASVYRLLGDKLREDGDIPGALDAYRTGCELAERAQSYSS